MAWKVKTLILGRQKPSWMAPSYRLILFCRLLFAISCQIKVQLYQTIKHFLSLSGGLVWSEITYHRILLMCWNILQTELNWANCDGFILSGDHFMGILVAIGKPLVEAFLSYFGSWLEYHGQYTPIFIGPRSDHSLPVSVTNWLTD